MLGKVDLKKIIINEISQFIIKESSDSYNEVIKKALKGEIPPSQGNYKWPAKGGSSFSIKIDPKDQQTWNKLYSVGPPKKGEEEGQTKGVGNGEVALYWLYNFNRKYKNKVEEGRVGDDPDLWFGDVGVEVKAYNKHSGYMNIGRFGADKLNLKLLNIIFGLETLSQVLDKEDNKSKAITPTNFNGVDLIPAFKVLFDFKSIKNLNELASQYGIFKSINNNVNMVLRILGEHNNNKVPKNPEEAAGIMSVMIMKSKLGRKPGDGGYLANISNSEIYFFGINISKIKDLSEATKNLSIAQSFIKINLQNLFQ